MNALLTLIMAICFFVAGWNLLKRPKAIQQWVLQLQQRNSLVAEMNPLRNWVDKKSFLFALRLLGGLCLLNFLMLILALMAAPAPLPSF